MTLTTLLLLAGAVYRATRLVVADVIFDAPRAWIMDRLERGGAFGEWAADLLSCPWCVSVWLAFPAAVAAWRYPAGPVFVIPAAALTASAVAGWLSSRE